MGALTKKYRLIWIIETKEMINNYQDDYSGSITLYPNDILNTCFESDNYQDILDKINTESLIKQKQIVPPPIPEQPPLI